MKKRMLTLFLTICLISTMLPVGALAVETPMEPASAFESASPSSVADSLTLLSAGAAKTLDVGSGLYDLTQIGLNAAISDANDGDTIKFIASGTITQTADIVINKSLTLDLNGQTIGFTTSFKGVKISSSASVTIKGPGTIAMNYFIKVESGATLTVQGDAEIEGTGWQPLNNAGTVSMTGGAIRQTSTAGGYTLQNAGTDTFENVTIESNCGYNGVISNSGNLTLNNCTIRSNYSVTAARPVASVISVGKSSEVTLNGGSVIGPVGSTVPAVFMHKGGTFTNNGASIINGSVQKITDLVVSVSSGAEKVTLAPQTPEAGVTYYYKTTAAAASRPTFYGNEDFDPAGWTAFSAMTDIAATGTDTVYVQVVKVGDIEQRIYGWGQGSAVPGASEPEPEPAPSTPSSSDSRDTIRTLTDTPTGLTVSGRLSRSATLRVNGFTPARNTTDPALAAIVERMNSFEDTMIFCADIAVSGSYSGPLTLSFEVGEQYNGQTVTLLHAKNGKLITYTAVVKDGIATFKVESLSPFALFAPVTAMDAIGIPKTGDGMRYGMIAAGMAALIAGIAVAHNRRTSKREAN